MHSKAALATALFFGLAIGGTVAWSSSGRAHPVHPRDDAVDQRLARIERALDDLARRPRPSVQPLVAAEPRTTTPLVTADVTTALAEILDRLAALERTAADLATPTAIDAPRGLPMNEAIVQALYADWLEGDRDPVEHDLVGLSADAIYGYLGSPWRAYLWRSDHSDVKWSYAFVDEDIASGDDARAARSSHKRLEIVFANGQVTSATIVNAFQW